MTTDTGVPVALQLMEEERRGSSELWIQMGDTGIKWGSECRSKGKVGGNTLPHVQMGTFCL